MFHKYSYLKSVLFSLEEKKKKRKLIWKLYKKAVAVMLIKIMNTERRDLIFFDVHFAFFINVFLKGVA